MTGLGCDKLALHLVSTISGKNCCSQNRFLQDHSERFFKKPKLDFFRVLSKKSQVFGWSSKNWILHDHTDIFSQNIFIADFWNFKKLPDWEQ